MTPVQKSFKSLEKYLIDQQFMGYDCYDALNSPVLRLLSGKSRFLRIAFIQLMKKSPVNFRPFLFVRKGHNPKGLGLLLSSFSKIYGQTDDKNYLKLLEFLANLLINIKTHGYSGACWGYNFDWQSRVFYVPKFTPTIVNTSYIGNGFLDAYEATRRDLYLETARSSCDFIIKDLYHTKEQNTLCFSYTPIDQLKVHNANILGAALLARVYSITKEAILLDYAKRSIDYVMQYQLDDGSWHYAETGIQQWIDSFHTGFVLESLHRFIESTGDRTYESGLRKGYEFFVNHFFLPDGTPKYYHQQTYPVDIHSAAQGIVTLTKLRGYQADSTHVLEKLINWTIQKMQSPKGYFYFQKHPLYTNRISYMRWSQCWMYSALTTYLTQRPPTTTSNDKGVI